MNGLDPTPQTITFAFLLTAAGAGVAAGIITALVQLIKVVFPAVFARVTGAGLAFIFSAILMLLAGIAVGADSLDEGLVVFLAWLTVATASVGAYEVVVNKALSRSSTP